MATSKRVSKKKASTKVVKKAAKLYSHESKDQPRYRYRDLNPDQPTRDKILADCFVDLQFSPGQKAERIRPGKPSFRKNFMAKFDSLDVTKLEELLQQKFINPTERRGSSAAVSHVAAFMKDFPEVTAHGFVTPVAAEKVYGVAIEGLAVPKKAWKKLTPTRKQQVLRAFTRFTARSTESGASGENALWCWYNG